MDAELERQLLAIKEGTITDRMQVRKILVEAKEQYGAMANALMAANRLLEAAEQAFVYGPEFD